MTTRTCNFLKSSYKTKEAPCILGMQEFKQKLGSSIFWYADVYNVHVSKSEFCYRNNIFLTKTSFGFGTPRFRLALALFLPLILFECVLCFGTFSSKNLTFTTLDVIIHASLKCWVNSSFRKNIPTISKNQNLTRYILSSLATTAFFLSIKKFSYEIISAFSQKCTSFWLMKYTKCNFFFETLFLLFSSVCASVKLHLFNSLYHLIVITRRWEWGFAP